MRLNCPGFYPVLWSVGAICGWSPTLCLSHRVRAIRDFSISARSWFLSGNAKKKKKEELECNHTSNVQPERSQVAFDVGALRWEPWPGWLTPYFHGHCSWSTAIAIMRNFPTLKVGPWSSSASNQTGKQTGTSVWFPAPAPHTSSGLNVADRNHSCTDDRPNLQLMCLLEMQTVYKQMCTWWSHPLALSLLLTLCAALWGT